MENLEETNKFEVLKEVVAYVEVRSKCENRSQGIAVELEKLGAHISFKLNTNVTHVVFKDGTKRTWNRAKKLGIPLVSVLWVDSCKRSLQHVDEGAFTVNTPRSVTEAEVISIFPKKQAQRFRSMQPKNLNEDFEDSSQRCRRRRKKHLHQTSDQQNSSPIDVFYTPVSDFTCHVPRLTTPPSMKEKLLEYSRGYDNTPVSNRSFQKLLFSDGSDVENSSPSEEKEIQKIESSKPFSFDASNQQDCPASNSINNQVSSITTEMPNLISPTSQHEIFNDMKQISPKAAVNKLLQQDQNMNNEKSCLDSPSPMKLSINKSIISSTVDVKSAKNFCTDVSDVPEECGIVDVGHAVFKNGNIFSKSPVKNPTSPLILSHCDLRFAEYTHPTKIYKQKFAKRETMHVLGICEEDHDTPVLTSLSSANIPCHITDGAGTNITSFTVKQEEVLVNGDSESLNSSSQPDLLTCHSRASVDNSQMSKAWEMRQKPKEVEKEKQVVRSQQTSSSFLSLSQTFTSDDQTVTPRFKRRKRSSSSNMSPVSRHLQPIKIYLVMTSMSTLDQELVKSVAKTLGECVISDCVKITTTHVICGMPRRTLNVLLALSQGCWLVSKEWVSASMTAGCWLDEKNFEMVESYPVAQIYREQKQLNSSPKLFGQCGNIYVSTVKAPPKKDLVELLQHCGGKVKNSICNASIYIGEEYHPSMISVVPLWIFDSISSGKALPFDAYLLGQPKPQSPEY